LAPFGRACKRRNLGFGQSLCLLDRIISCEFNRSSQLPALGGANNAGRRRSERSTRRSLYRSASRTPPRPENAYRLCDNAVSFAHRKARRTNIKQTSCFRFTQRKRFANLAALQASHTKRGRAFHDQHRCLR
jgi:hypothetical protein